MWFDLSLVGTCNDTNYIESTTYKKKSKLHWKYKRQATQPTLIDNISCLPLDVLFYNFLFPTINKGVRKWKESLQNHHLSLNNYRNVIVAKCKFHVINSARIFEEVLYHIYGDGFLISPIEDIWAKAIHSSYVSMNR